ncbi:MAG: DUF4239 domain-containing protein [Betaproteobacteria bacterium]
MFLKNFDHWVHGLPDFQIFALMATSMVVAVAAAPHMLRLIYRREISTEVSDGAVDAYKSIVTFMVFLLAFSLVLVQNHYHAAEEIITKEANTIHTLDRQLLRLAGEQALTSRATLKEYAKSIVRDEWPTMANSDRAAETTRLLGQLNASVLSVDTTTNREQSVYHQVLVHLDELSDLREHRLESSEEGLGNLYWGTVAGLVALLVLLASLTQATPQRAFALGGLICAAALMVSMVVILNKPFTGETVVSLASLERVIKAMEVRG